MLPLQTLAGTEEAAPMIAVVMLPAKVPPFSEALP
jgi:hypothetical protein